MESIATLSDLYMAAMHKSQSGVISESHGGAFELPASTQGWEVGPTHDRIPAASCACAQRRNRSRLTPSCWIADTQVWRRVSGQRRVVQDMLSSPDFRIQRALSGNGIEPGDQPLPRGTWNREGAIRAGQYITNPPGSQCTQAPSAPRLPVHPGSQCTQARIALLSHACV